MKILGLKTPALWLFLCRFLSLCEEIARALREYPVYNEDVLAECESLIEEELSEIEDAETRMQMLIEAPAALICESLLKPYL